MKNSEIFYVVLIGPFVKFYHLVYIHVMCSVCCQILGGLEFILKWQNYSFNGSP